MTVDSIKQAQGGKPFKPFAIRMSDGREFQVPKPDSLLFAEQGKTLIVVTSDQKFHILATDLVASISR